MMKKLVGMVLALVLATGMTGIGTLAYFTDAGVSSSNQLLAGTLDLKTGDVDGVSRTLYATAMSPGDTAGPAVITLKNAGTTSGASLDIVFSYAESDGSPNSVNKIADELAAMMEVMTLSYGVPSLLGSIGDVNINGYKDVYDLKNSIFTGLTGIAAGASQDFVISVRLRGETPNDFQADGIVITMTFTLKQ